MSTPDCLNLTNVKTPQEETATEPMDMVLIGVGMGDFVHYETNGSCTKRVQWIGLETDSDGSPVKTRTPSQTTTIFDRNSGLTVAGKTYPSFQSFLKNQDGDWGEDMYGRKVFCAAERFPCFDFFDSLYENRYFRWYFIRKGNSLSRVFCADEQDEIYVTEDVQDIDIDVWGKMKDVGFCRIPKDM